jgi:hypothetical protein
MRRRRRDVAHSLFVMHHTPYEDFIPVISLELPQSRTMKYYDLKKNWRKVRRHLADEELNEVLVRDFTNSPTVGGERNLHSDASHLNLRLAIGPLIIGEDALHSGNTRLLTRAIGW